MNSESHGARLYPPKPTDVYLFATCLVDQFAPEAGLDTVLLLEREGIRVHFLEQQTCCGQPAYSSGYPDEARAVALAGHRAIGLLWRDDSPPLPSTFFRRPTFAHQGGRFGRAGLRIERIFGKCGQFQSARLGRRLHRGAAYVLPCTPSNGFT